MRFQSPFVLVIFLLSGAACAQAVAPAPSTTPSAPLGFPTPGYTPAGAGAPVVGQPGTQARPFPRSPNNRVLPSTAEPGLWAADELRPAESAKADDAHAARRRSPDAPPPTVDELLVATPSPGAPAAPGCRERLLRASRMANIEERRRFLPQSARDCANARLILHCESSKMTDAKARATVTPNGPDHIAAQDKALDAVLRWQLAVCHHVTMISPFEVVIADVINAFERQRVGR